jgi:hypothetical protein
MSSFVLYDIEKDDILNQYNVDNSESGNSNQSGSNFTVYNLVTIEGVNDLQIQNNESGYGTLLIGYTPITDNLSESYGLYFLTENNLDYIDAQEDPTNTNILRVPNNAKINKIIVKNAKNQAIISNVLCIIFTTTSDSSIIKPIIGNFDPPSPSPVNFNIFNSQQIGQEIIEPLDSSYFFVLNIDDSIIPNQLEINIYYTIE